MLPYVQVTFLWRDGTGSETTTVRYLPAATPSATAQARAAALGARMQAVSGCALLGYELLWRHDQDLPADPTTPDNPHGVFFFTTDTDWQFFSLAVPGLFPALLLPPATPGEEPIEIDQAAPAVASLIGELLTGGWCNPFGYDLAELGAAYIQVREHGRRYIP